MSTVDIKVEIPPESQALLKGLNELPAEIPQAIKRGMDRALSIVRGRIQEKRLSGVGPYPVPWHRLGERTGLLRSSLLEDPSVITEATATRATVVGGIRTNVFYAKVHEFGMTILPRSAPSLVFRVPRGSRFHGTAPASPEETLVFAKKVVIPPRAPLTTGVTENVPYIASEIGSEIEKSMKNISK